MAKRLVNAAMLVLMVLVIPVFAAADVGNNEQAIWEVITIHGSSAERGNQYGDQLKKAIEINLDLFWNAAEQKGYSIEEVLEAGQTFEENMMRVDPAIIEEIEGMAASTGISYEELLAFNALEDIVFDDGCTTLLATGSATKDGKAYFHKTRDTSTSLEQVVIEVFTTGDDYDFIAVVTAGSTGVSMGINEHGVSAGNTALSTWDSGSGLGNLTVNRRILQQASSASAAVDVVEALNNNRSSGSNYLVADANEAVSMETTHSAMAVRWVVDEAVACANNYTLPEMLAYDSNSNYESSILRRARANELLQENYGDIDVEVMLAISKDKNDENEANCINRSTTVSTSTFDGTNLLMYAQLGRPGLVPVELYDLGALLFSEMEEAIQAAVETIGNIPDKLNIEHMLGIRIPRSLVNLAINLGAEEECIANLDKLEAAEETMAELFRGNYMRQSLLDIPVPPAENISGWAYFARNKRVIWHVLHYRTVKGIQFRPELAYLSYSYSDVSEPRWVEYDISGRGYKYVKGYAGITDDSSRTEYPLTYELYGDGDLIYSTFLEFGEYPSYYLVDIEGIESLRFSYHAETTNSSGGAARGLFVEPQFLIPINEEMLDAIAAAEEAIAGLPEAISLMDESAVQAARVVVEEALELGVEKEGRINNLDTLASAEETIHNLYHQLFEVEGLLDISPGFDTESGNNIIFEDPDRWGLYDDWPDDRFGVVNLRSFAPLKTFNGCWTLPRDRGFDISDKDYMYVEGHVGISDDSTRESYPLEFVIQADGDTIFSAKLEYGRDAEFYRLDLDGVDELVFNWSAPWGDDGGRANRPVYTEPRFLYSPKLEVAKTEAEGAIGVLPAEINIADEAAVRAARAKVNNALAIGVDERDISNLSVLIAAEEVIAAPVIYGDINGDGIVNVADVIMVLQKVIGIRQFDTAQLKAADVDGSEGIDVTDAILILQYIVGVRDFFPVETN